VDQQGHVYISGAGDIHRLSPDGTFSDIVLSNHDGVDEPRTPFYVYLVVLCIVSSVDKLYGVLIWKSNYCFKHSVI
jgi:hypothetical protein